MVNRPVDFISSMSVEKSLSGLATRIYSTAPLWQYERILARKADLDQGDTWLKLNGAKIFADGSLGSKTAAFQDPYHFKSL